MTAVVEGLGISREDWEATPESVRRLVAELRSAVEVLRRRVSELDRRVCELEEKLRTNSGNSSLPPSADRQRPMTRAGVR